MSNEKGSGSEDLELAVFDKVMNLSNLEICRQLAEIQSLKHYEKDGVIYIANDNGADYRYDPLVDNEQLDALTKEFDVTQEYEEYDCIGMSYHVKRNKNPIRVTEYQFEERPDFSKHKAICLAVVLYQELKNI